MKIGMPALIELNTIEDNVALCEKLGFDFIELNMNFPYNMISKVDPMFLRNISKKNNIEFTMHMPDEADIGSFFDDVRNGYLNLFIETIRWANESNIKLLNMHIIKGPYMTLPDKKIYINEKYSDEYMHNFLTSIKKISEEATKNKVMICIENSNNFGLDYVQKLLEKSLLLDNIFLTWDVGHDYISNYSDKKVLFKYKDKIRHMHLHDASNNRDHLVLNEGELDIKGLLCFANAHNISTLIEVKSRQALIKSKEQITKNLVER